MHSHICDPWTYLSCARYVASEVCILSTPFYVSASQYTHTYIHTYYHIHSHTHTHTHPRKSTRVKSFSHTISYALFCYGCCPRRLHGCKRGCPHRQLHCRERHVQARRNVQAGLQNSMRLRGELYDKPDIYIHV